MSELPEAKWFCDFGASTGLEPMAVPIHVAAGHVAGNTWYVEGIGHVDNHNRILIGGMPRSTYQILEPIQELVAWRRVANHLNDGGDIMDITVPHEDGITDGDPETTKAIQRDARRNDLFGDVYRLSREIPDEPLSARPGENLRILDILPPGDYPCQVEERRNLDLPT